MTISILCLIGGSGFLFFGADWMIKSSVHIASKLNISKFVIGLTVVAFGTSLPELGVSIKAAIYDKSGIAIGNIIGSNITNVLLVLGLCSLVNPITITYSKIKKDIFIYLGVCFALIVFLVNGILEQTEGIFLFTSLIIYTVYSFYNGKATEEEIQDSISSWYLTFILLILGILFLFIGSELFVEGAIRLATILGVSDVVIGMTIVALGTSLPELVTSIVAGFKKEHSISVGNIIGSNLFNILSVLGIVSIIMPLNLKADIFKFEIPVMVISGLILIPLSLQNKPIPKWSSITMLFGYMIFIFVLMV